MEHGVYHNLGNDAYHSAPGVSKSGLDLIAKCPALYRHQVIDGNLIKLTPAMLFGSAAHTAILEPDKFDNEYIVEPKIDKRTKVGKDKFAQFQADNAGKVILKLDDYNNIMGMRSSILSHPKASAIIRSGDATEISVFHNLGETLVKIRPDLIAGGVIVDLKTTNNAREDNFAKSCYNYRYHVQAAFYQHVYTAETGVVIDDFIFIVVEKTPPYQVAIYAASERMKELGEREFRHDIAIYRDCVESGNWPGYNSDKIEWIDLPSWAYRK